MDHLQRPHLVLGELVRAFEVVDLDLVVAPLLGSRSVPSARLNAEQRVISSCAQDIRHFASSLTPGKDAGAGGSRCPGRRLPNARLRPGLTRETCALQAMLILQPPAIVLTGTTSAGVIVLIRRFAPRITGGGGRNIALVTCIR